MKKAIIVLFAVLFGAMQAKAYHFEQNGIYYNFVEGTADEVEVTYLIDYRGDDFDGEGDYYDDILIPETIRYKGKQYRVTGISEQTFRESGVEAITIPKSVKYIGVNAFRSCSALKRIEVKWENPLNLKDMEEKYPTCYDISYTAQSIFDFGEQYFEDVILVVPKNTKALYQEQYVWKNFTNIEEKDAKNNTSFSPRKISILNGTVNLEVRKGVDFPCIGLQLSDRKTNMALGTYLEIKKRGDFYLIKVKYDPEQYLTIDKGVEDYLKELFNGFYEDEEYSQKVWLVFVEEGGLQLFIDTVKEFTDGDDEFFNSPFNEIYG
ncbi:hypothetical protein M2132_001875 [Dysgonomonas sp. PH5-45]|uniref:leucine-rich repeat protein n=1 Tax=unclassified Dysgonomonas TaxID=2630389 RepID=UPI00247727F4|nr:MULTISPECIES: leucine-rich repeat protein [unclassified Dysgonomonas]MDH6355530.1 hypothetical protein [Dysgonomonas sp. PH5-45]MDH6388409.1 hypothetical protein [Dysgonomonas sp. PH5-37]